MTLLKRPQSGGLKKLEEDIMKRLFIWTVISIFALSLAACAGSSSGGDPVKVKCPSCGYQFDVEEHG